MTTGKQFLWIAGFIAGHSVYAYIPDTFITNKHDQIHFLLETSAAFFFGLLDASTAISAFDTAENYSS